MNEENLKSFDKRTESEQREIAKKGGIASGKARRQKKTTSQLVNTVLNSKLDGNKKKILKKNYSDLDESDCTVNALLIAGMVSAAREGNVKAWQELQSYLDKAEKADEADQQYHLPISDITVDFVELYRVVHDVFDGNSSVREIICKGGRGSIKSNFWAGLAEETIYNDPQAHIVFTRRYKTDLRGSVYNQFIKTITRHGKTDEWDFQVSPMQAIYKKTGQTVQFIGADKPISSKSSTMPFGYVKLLIHEESDEMQGVEQMDYMEDTFLRADTPALDVKIFNPPKSANNFMNEYTASKDGDPATFVCHSFYYNVPVKWLGKRFFERAEWFKQHKPKYYANNYLGEVTGTGGSIFENVNVRKITDEEIEAMPYFSYGLDFGYEHPQVFIKSYYDRDKDILYCIEEVYSKKCKNSTFARKIAKYKKHEIIADSARPDSIAEMNDWGFIVRGAVKRWGANKGRDYCWEWLQQTTQIVVDPERTPHLKDELLKLEFEQLKDGTFSSEYPRLNEDCIMALIYGLNREIRESRREDLYSDETDDEEEEFDE
ncbi:MAG: phage terminase large subunit [Clostridia bacterium]|nr:phage terminase large subunit [Clostridia bacterium]